jgi:hypothetical protein
VGIKAHPLSLNHNNPEDVVIINRKAPNTHTCCGFTFHPGAQFVADAFYAKTLKDNADFKSQTTSHLMEIIVPVAEAGDGKQPPPKPKHNLAETVVALSEEKALEVISATIDGIDLKEISKLDKRRRIVEAAETQIEMRQGTMNGMAPRIPTGSQPPINIGEFE